MSSECPHSCRHSGARAILVNGVLSPQSDGDATLVNAVFESSQWCACPLVNAVLNPHSDGDATLVNAVFESSVVCMPLGQC